MKKFYFLSFLACLVLCISGSAFSGPEPNTAEELGRMLFFDPILSGTRTISCASCHKPQFAFADTAKFSRGVYGRLGVRNTPSAMNVKLHAGFFWDGRASTLEEQALVPITNSIEMDLPVDVAVRRLNGNKKYRSAFQSVFHKAADPASLVAAIAAFERTLETNASPFDDWRLNDNENAVTESAKRGFALFNGKANCVKCHSGPDFNSTQFRNIGLYNGKDLADIGRAAFTHNNADRGKFKIGSLRNIAITSPYMHNGMFRTLRGVIDYYNDPDKVVSDAIGRDSLLSKPLGLTHVEKNDLEDFLRSLTDKQFVRHTQY